MNTFAHIRWGLAALKRVLEVLVIWPAIAIGGFIFATGFTGDSPIRQIVVSNYAWGDEAFRAAPAGTVLVEEADLKAMDGATLNPPVLATHRRFTPVAIQEAIDNSTAALTNFYWLCVMFSTVLMVAVLGFRGFIGLPPRAVRANEG